jgi:hypothetical protein
MDRFLLTMDLEFPDQRPESVKEVEFTGCCRENKQMKKGCKRKPTALPEAGQKESV